MSGQQNGGPYFADESPLYSGADGTAVIRVTRSPTDTTQIGIAYGTWSPAVNEFLYILYINGVKLSGNWVIRDGQFEPSAE